MDSAIVVGLALVLVLQVTLHIRIGRILVGTAARFNRADEARRRDETASLQEANARAVLLGRGQLAPAPAIVAELHDIVTELRTLQRECAELMLATSGTAERPTAVDDPEQRKTIEMVRQTATRGPHGGG